MTPLLDRADVRAVLQIPSGLQQRAQSRPDGEAPAPHRRHRQQQHRHRPRLCRISLSVSTTTGCSQSVWPEKGITDPPVQIETVGRAWYNPNQESHFYYVPSLIATMLFIFSLLLTSIGIVREKEIGTIEQVMVTPIRRSEFILGKTIPYMITGYISMTFMLLVAYLVFGVHVRGSLLLLYGLTGIYLAGNMGIALIISGSAQTQQQALLTSFLVLMPSVMLSGFLFPVTNMPESIRIATLGNPMRWYLEILRGIVMKDVGISRPVAGDPRSRPA